MRTVLPSLVLSHNEAAVMVKYKSEWKDVRAVFWIGLTLGIVIGWMLASVVVR